MRRAVVGAFTGLLSLLLCLQFWAGVIAAVAFLSYTKPVTSKKRPDKVDHATLSKAPIIMIHGDCNKDDDTILKQGFDADEAIIYEPHG